MKKPSSAERSRSLDIRCRSKMGQYVCDEDRDWNTKIYKKYHEWYTKTENIVFNRTMPFGSQAEKKAEEEGLL